MTRPLRRKWAVSSSSTVAVLAVSGSPARALRAKASSETLAHLSSALLYGLQGVFLVTALIAAATLLVAWLFPKGMASEHQHPER